MCEYKIRCVKFNILKFKFEVHIYGLLRTNLYIYIHGSFVCVSYLTWVCLCVNCLTRVAFSKFLAAHEFILAGKYFSSYPGLISSTGE